MTNRKGIAIVGFAMMVVGQIIHTIGATLTMDYYTNPQYFSVWSKLMTPSAGPPPVSFMIVSLIFGLITSLIFAWFYSIVKNSIPGDTVLSKGINYGLLMFLTVGVTFTLNLILLINLPMGLISSWTVDGLIVFIVGGVLAAKYIT